MRHADRIERQPHAGGILVIAVRQRLSEDVLDDRHILDDLVFPLFPASAHRRRKQRPQKPFQDVLPLETPRSEEPPGWVVTGPGELGASLDERSALLAGQSGVIRRLQTMSGTIQKNENGGACLLEMVSSR